METYPRQTDDAAKAGAKLVVWPETAFPGYLRDDTELAALVTQTAQRDNLAIVVGSNERDLTTTPDADANSLILVTPDGRIGTSYAKRQLVPFGEFVPGRKWLGFLEALHLTIYDRAAGKPVQPLLDAGTPVGKIGSAICYESSYSRLTQEQVKRGANILVVASDDTWFGRTAAASQHAAISSVRAAESDRYLVRAAPTGISRVIDPAGRVLDEGQLFREKVVMAKAEARKTMPPFNRYGDWFVVVAGGILLLSLAASARRRTDGIPG
jgi:apolipoprotein N-acyltransferase